MEIPYEVKARPDTGLWNAKIGIWLFLASEVMLFGGLFSGYVFLRLGSGADADYHWPHGLLNVTLGFINTLVLIFSSVCVVFAWVKLKLRDWNGFRIWMGLVLLCALAFLVIKSFEYKAKFEHYGVDLNDKTVVEGHHLEDEIVFEEIDQITVNFKTTSLELNSLIHGEMRGKLAFQVKPDDGTTKGLLSREQADPANFFAIDFPDGEYELTAEEKEEIDEAYAKVVENLEGEFELAKPKLRQIKAAVDAHREAKLKPLERVRQIEYAALVKQINDGLEVTEEVERRKISLGKPRKWFPAAGLETVSLVPNKPFSIKIKRSKLRALGDGVGTLRDQTSFVGNLSEDERYITLHVDNIDLRNVKNPEDSVIWEYFTDSHGDGDHAGEGHHDLKAMFLEHQKAKIAAAEEKGNEPHMNDTKRMHLHKEDFGGHYPEIKIPVTEVETYSNFTPKRNTYLAIYFTLTGLHGLHVLIGALVLAYFLFFGKKMFDEDPEHLANRVEVGGLFWHFVDLVWIFLFPILYLM